MLELKDVLLIEDERFPRQHECGSVLQSPGSGLRLQHVSLIGLDHRDTSVPFFYQQYGLTSERVIELELATQEGI